MSKKAFDKLNSIDLSLRKLFPPVMTGGVKIQLTIEKICGFELFNTRPYHNYETWSDGWRIRCDDIVVEEEDLDDAVKHFIHKYKEVKCQKS